MNPPALAKLTRPRLHDVLARGRLHDLLDAACTRPLVWIGAEPGAGKTTLIAGYLKERARRGIWYQVDGGDADAASFVYHLRLAAQAHDAGAAAALPLLTPEYRDDLPGFARRFFRALYTLLGAQAVLVLDNHQDAGDAGDFHRLVADGLAQLPEGSNVIVASRDGPPPAYAPLLAAGAVATIDAGQLRLTIDETTAIADRRGIADPAAVQLLHERSHGWAAGLTLLLMGGEAPAEAVADDAEALRHVFGYFAQRVFDSAAPAQRLALMQLSYLPVMAADAAEAMTGRGDMRGLLEHFYRRHLFTDRRRLAGGAVAFQFHALFRAFLQHQARQTLSADEQRASARRAAALLAGAGAWEGAFELHAAMGDDTACAQLVLQHAEALLVQGRQQALVERLAHVGAAARAADPWLCYWEGRAWMHAAPDRALSLLADTLQRFAAAGHAAGQLACAAAAVQTLWYARLGWSEITTWVERLEPLLQQLVPAAQDGATVAAGFPTPSSALMTWAALHAALAFCRPDHAATHALAQHLLGLLDDDRVGWDQRLATATHLMTYLHNAAELDLVQRLVAKVDGEVERRPASALNRAYWYVFRAMHDLRGARLDTAAELFSRARELARDEGLRHAEFAALQFHAYLDVLRRRADSARERIAILQTHPARGHADAEMNLAVVQAMCAQLEGRHAAAAAHADRALLAIAEVGAAYFQAVFPVLLVSVYADAGLPGRALAIVAAARQHIGGSYLRATQAQLLLEEAYVHHVQGEVDLCRGRLAEGLGLAAADDRQAAYAHRIVARKPLLLALALQQGIEVDFVRRVVRHWRLPPPQAHTPNWPWPLRVLTLGRFELQVDEVPVSFGRKAPKKTLALLKAIVARGGSAPESALIDIFWPDEDGDAAARSLGAAVHRLRTLVVHADAIVQQGGVVALDRSLVWVDAIAFEAALAQADPAEHADGAAQVLALYGGSFLAEDEHEPWAVAMRERLRTKFIHAVVEHGARLEAAGRDEEAVAWYRRGIEADAVVEPFTQGLMRCFQRLDRLSEAVAAYRRLKQTLSVTLSLPPSRATERLYQQLRDAAPPR